MVDDAYEMRDEPDVNSQVGVDRLNVSIYLPFADVTVGRQAISFGKAYLWNPLDVFRPFDPTSFDRDYKIGVDALRVDMPFGETGTVTMVGALSLGDGNEDHGVWFGSAALARVGWMAATWDWVVQGGKVYGGFQVGGAASGDIKNLSVRLEGMHFEPLADDEFDRHQSLVLGVGRAFQNTLNIQLEYFYNGGAGALRDSAVDAVVPPGAPVDALSSEHLNRIVALVRGVLNGRLYHTSEHLAGLVVTYEILPILKANLATIVSVSEPSALIQPGLTYSAADEVDVVIGAMFSAGARRSGEEPVCQALGGCLESEFGTYPHVFYLQSKIYF